MEVTKTQAQAQIAHVCSECFEALSCCFHCQNHFDNENIFCVEIDNNWFHVCSNCEEEFFSEENLKGLKQHLKNEAERRKIKEQKELAEYKRNMTN